VRNCLAILLVLAFIGASTQCVAECAGQACETPPCHQHSPPDPCRESQLVASAPVADHAPATLIELTEWSPQSTIDQTFHPLDFGFEPLVEETPPRLTVLRI